MITRTAAYCVCCNLKRKASVYLIDSRFSSCPIVVFNLPELVCTNSERHFAYAMLP